MGMCGITGEIGYFGGYSIWKAATDEWCCE